MKIEFSNTYRSKKARIKRLPTMTDDMLSAARKRDANRFIEIFHDGIRDDTLGLARLAFSTIRQKERKGYSAPESPLYGAGDDRKNTLANSLRMRKLKNGWSVRASKARHHEANIPLDVLLKIHETGAKIQKGESIIQLFPRPARTLAYLQVLKEIRQDVRETSREVKQAITEYINEGREKEVNSILEFVKDTRFDATND